MRPVIIPTLLIGTFLLSLVNANAGTKNDPHAPITHCYHWLDEASDSYLTYKYNWAQSHGNELTFYTTPGTSNGSVAGPGLYCAKSPSGSYSYGNRVIRVDLVDDVVLYDAKSGIQYCGTQGENSNNSTTCRNKDWDIKFYSGGGVGNAAWYVIQNPMAISHWSANSDILISDLNTSSAINDVNFKSHAGKTLSYIQSERASMGEQVFYNQNARLSIIDIMLNDPAKLDSIPPLNIVSRLAGNGDQRLSVAEREDAYKKYIDKALSSDEIPYGDYKKILDKNQDVSIVFEGTIKRALGQSSKYNNSVLLKAINDNPGAYGNISAKTYSKLVNKAFQNPFHMEELADSSLAQNQLLASFVKREIQQLKSSQPDPAKSARLPKLLKTYYSAKDAAKEIEFWLAKLYTVKNPEVSILLSDGSKYGLDASSAFSAQCKGVLEFIDASGKTMELRYHKTKLSLGSAIAQSCERGQVLVDVLATLPKDEEVRYVITGKIESTPFTFIGNNIENFQAQCSAFYPSVPNKTNVDEIYHSINGSGLIKSYNSDSYWKTEQAVCSKLMSAISTQVPTRLLAQWREEAQRLKPSYIVEGKIENRPYLIYGETLEDFESKCSSLYNSTFKGTDVDEIYYGVNGASSLRLYNSDSYWKSESAVCSTLINAIAANIPTKALVALRASAANAKADYVVEGAFEKQPYVFFGDDLEAIGKQCEDYYPNLRDASDIDEIYHSVNGSNRLRAYNSDSYWKTKSALCGALQSAISNQIPTRRTIRRRSLVAEARTQAQSRNAKYTVSGRFETQNFFFYGDNLEEVKLMCHAFYPMLDGTSDIDEIYYSVNGDSQQREYNSDTYWRTKDSLCNQLAFAISEKVPSLARIAADIEVRKLQAQANATNADYKVGGKFEGQDYFFYGSTQEDITKMCHDFYQHVQNKSQIDRITYNVNGSGTKGVTTGGYWTTKTQLCSALIGAIGEQVPTLAQLAARAEVARLRDAGQSAKFRVSGDFNGQEFFFYGNHRDEVAAMCESFYPHVQGRPKIDTIYYRVNGGARQKAYNSSSYWTSKNDLCSAFKSAISSSIPDKRTIKGQELLANWNLSADSDSPSLIVRGKVVGQPFLFHGNTVEDIKRKCSIYYTYFNNRSQLDEMSLTINDGDTKVATNSSGYWNTEDALCGKIIEIVQTAHIEIESAKRSKKAKDDFYAKFTDLDASAVDLRLISGVDTLFLSAATSGEAHAQCLEMLPLNAGDFSSLETLEFKIGTNTHSVKLGAYTADIEGFCSEMERVLMFHLPNQELREHEEEFSNSKAKYKVKAKLNGASIFFFGKNKDEIGEQCKRVYAESTTEDTERPEITITWSVNEDSKERTINLENSTIENACEKLSQEVLKGKFSRFLRSIF